MTQDISAAAPQTAVTRSAMGGLGFRHLNELGLLAVILALYAVFWSFANGFLTPYNQLNILRDAASIGIAAWGATLIIIAGEIDVSVGPMVAFLSVTLSFLLKWAVPLPIGLILVLALGVLLGGAAGSLRAYLGVPSFIVTLGLWKALRGLALSVTDALPVSFGQSDVMDRLADDIYGVPTSAIVMLILFAAFAFISRKTAYGRSVYAVGGNANAAHLCGIDVRRIRILLFATAGGLAAVTAILLTARLGSGNAGAASGLEFDVISAVVVGGTSLAGGRGSMLGTLLGVLLISVIGNGLVLLGINSFLQEVVSGGLLVGAVLLNIVASGYGARRERMRV